MNGEISGAYEQRAVSELARRVTGPVLIPGDPAYEAERSGFQTRRRHRPDVIVGATGVADVRAAVGYAAARRLPVAVQATGHGLAVPADGGVLVTTGRMTGLRIDPVARTAWVAAGVSSGDLVRAAARHGLAPLSGSFPGTGVVGYTLAGGFGLLARQFGYAADRVRRIELVTADGVRREASPHREPELFWGLRGGGGNFGVVTGMEVELLPLERVFGGRLLFDGAHAETVLRGWQRWAESAPEALTSSATLLPYPDLPQLPEAVRGRYLVQLQLAFAGPVEEGEELVRPLRELAPVESDTLRELPFTESATIHDEPAEPHGYRAFGVALDGGLAGSELRSVLDLTGPGAPMMCVLGMRHLGGALARRPAVESAVPHRDARFLLSVLSVPEGPEEPEGPDGPDGAGGSRGAGDGPLPSGGDAAVTALHERVRAVVRAQTLGSCLAMLFGAQPEVVRAAFPPETHRRLAALKGAVDPENLFRLNHNIPPR
ncbi:FAD-binding oxidoreductase [Streptomyces sp. AJS327]|uniref:FAD-binding oxidoreductase n=1 Tax=Streptomyces sp. AJS327 TaxID=2545265 RepID=UPI0015DDF1E8|nr:FAD-binding oxidoreductase [Streptomyces sp. AJS327]MBA0052735.1 FAD-binding oxidoreductase [Streptomyces sp. AJS327]